jgi:hypothetical protein
MNQGVVGNNWSAREKSEIKGIQGTGLSKGDQGDQGTEGVVGKYWSQRETKEIKESKV